MMQNSVLVPVITIDGLSGTGKSTIGKLLARELGWHFFNSGVLYRVLAVVAKEQQLNLSDPSALAELASNLAVEFISGDDGEDLVLFLGGDLTNIIRGEEISKLASQIAVFPEVRAALLKYQLTFARLPGLVADGRDMGTVVFPDAQLKIFLTASLAERVKRRTEQLKVELISANLADLEAKIRERDQRDQQRLIAPVLPADDAVCIDTDNLQPVEIVFKIKELLAAKKI